MRSGLKRLGFGAAYFVALLVLAILAEHVRGRWALHRHVSDLEARSEKLTIAAVEPKHPAPDENGFVFLGKITNQVSTVITNLNPPPSLRFVAPGRVVVSWRLDQWPGERKETNDWTRLAELDSQGTLLAQIREAVQKPAFDSGFDFSKGLVDFKVGHLATVTSDARLLSAVALYNLHVQRPAAAFENLHALVLLAAKQSPEPLILMQLVRIACEAIAFNATWQALQAPSWSEAELLSLQKAWEQCDFVGDMARAFEAERALTLDYFEQLEHSGEKLRFVLDRQQKALELMPDFAQVPFVREGFFRRWFYLPLWRFAWADQDQLRALDRWDAMIDRERFARTNYWVGLARGHGAPPALTDELLNPYDRLRFLLSTEPFSISDTMIRRGLAAQTEQQLAIAALAINRYRLRVGKLPNDLGALSPEYLSTLPRDWMDGKPIRYRLLRPDAYSLYSVGDDGTDNGGDAAPSAPKKAFHRFWDGRDAAWPTPATDAEAAEALKRSL